MYYYAFTLRKNAQPVWITDYDDHVKSLTSKYKHITIEYHYEDTAGLHMHGMISTPKKIHIRMIHPGVGWNLDMSFVKSSQAWDAYCTKDAAKETTLINDEYNKLQEYLDYNNSEDYPSEPEDFVPNYKTINLFTGKPL